MSVKSKIKIQCILYYLLLIGVGVVFFFLVGEKGPIIEKDSISFLNPSTWLLTNYWLYPTFLRMCKIVFGELYFLQVAYVIQSALAIVTSFILAEFFRKEYNLSYISAFFVYALSFLPYGYSLPENVVSHHILTEALSIPVFTLFIVYVLKMYLYDKKRYIVISFALSLILVLIRFQLLIMPVILVTILFFKIVKNIYDTKSIKTKKKIITLGVVSICVSVVGISYIFYNILQQNKWSQFTEAVTGRVLCLIDYDDREFFEGDIKEVFDEIYYNIENNGNLLEQLDVKEKRVGSIAYIINENTKAWRPIIDEYLENKYDSLSSPEGLTKIDIRDTMILQLFDEHLFEYVVLILRLMPESLVASIFIQPNAIYELCHVITFLLYILSFVLIVIAKKMGCDKKIVIPMLITLFVLLINALALNIIFYGQQRYVVYTFGMFYISTLILTIGIFRKWKETRNSKLE